MGMNPFKDADISTLEVDENKVYTLRELFRNKIDAELKSYPKVAKAIGVSYSYFRQLFISGERRITDEIREKLNAHLRTNY